MDVVFGGCFALIYRCFALGLVLNVVFVGGCVFVGFSNAVLALPVRNLHLTPWVGVGVGPIIMSAGYLASCGFAALVAVKLVLHSRPVLYSN